jgi:hypothetical protein
MHVYKTVSDGPGADGDGTTGSPPPMYGARFSTMDSAVLGLASSGCGCCTVRVFQTGVYTRGCHLTPRLLRLKLYHACDQWHSSREFTLLPVDTVNCVTTLKGKLGDRLPPKQSNPFCSRGGSGGSGGSGGKERG